MKVRSIGVKICDRMQAELFMKLAMRTGEILLVNGAEIYRVEDTVSRILATSDDIDEVEVASTYSSIMISFYYNGYVTSIKKIKDRTINLDKISKTNDFTRNFVNSDIELSEANRILDEIESTKSYDSKRKVIAAAFGSTMFTLALDGSFIEGFIAFIAVLIGQYVLTITRDSGRKYFMETVYGALVVSTVSVISHYFGLVNKLDVVIIGSIMLLFPGVVMTNSVRDFMNGDLMSGLIGFIQALFIAIALGLGVGLIMRIYMYLGGVM